jgi:chromate reductase, NAD(P)H dehydrogenase (quinone)
MKIFGWAGSLRAGSASAGLLRAAAALAPPDMVFGFYHQQQAELPYFSPDLDGEGTTPPAPVTELRRSLAASDGVLIVCPEYAHGVPGVFKNALDWIVSSGELGGKPTAVLMASPSGAEHARAGLLPTLQVMEARIVLDESVRFVRTHLGSDGQLLDASVKAAVERALAALRDRLIETR